MGGITPEQSIVEIFPTAHLLPAIDDAAEQLSGLLGVVTGRVSLAAIEIDVRCLASLGQHGLTVGQASERCGIETGERMERIALHVQTRNRCIEEAQVEAAVMPDQDRPFATIGL